MRDGRNTIKLLLAIEAAWSWRIQAPMQKGIEEGGCQEVAYLRRFGKRSRCPPVLSY
jgi:hypothetical protein